MHPAFQECIRRLYLLPTRLSMTAIREHTEMQHVATRLSEETGKLVKLPSYKQVRTEVQRLKMEPELVAVREGAKSVPRERESAESFVLSIPAPALLTQVDEHTMELYVVTPDGTTVASRVHAAVLVCVKTAAILGAVLSLGPLKEEDYMRLLKMALEPKDRLVSLAGCQHSWPCSGKPAIVFHDRGKIFTSERARQVLETVCKGRLLLLCERLELPSFVCNALVRHVPASFHTASQLAPLFLPTPAAWHRMKVIVLVGDSASSTWKHLDAPASLQR